MIRSVVAVLLLVGAGAARGDDKDPVKDKLFAAKQAYDAEMREYRKSAGEWFDKREDAARKDGNKKLVDQIVVERKAFDEDGELPKSMPVAVRQKSVQAKKTLEAAYARAVKEYVQTKKDTEAAGVEEEWKVFARGNATDLLALVDTKTHSINGEWKKDGKALVVVAGNQAHLQLPYEPGEEYDLELTCRRVQGDDGVGIGLVAGGRQTMVIVDAYPSRGYETGFEYVNNKQVTTFKGPLLKPDKDTTIKCTVRSGKIDLLVGGKAVGSFKGDFAQFSLNEPHRPPNAKALFLMIGGSKCSFQFDRIVVTPVKGKGTILK